MCNPLLMALLSLLIIPLLLILLFLLLSFSIFRSKKPVQKLPPGPRKLPIIGNLHQLGDVLHRSLFELSKKHGPLMFLKLGRVPTVVVSGAEVAKEFMKTHDLECCSRPFFTPTARLSYNYLDVGFAPYGPQWREMRKIIILQFTSPKRVLLNKSIRREEIERMMTSISSEPVVNLSEKLHILATDITCRAAFGRRESSRLHSILEETQTLIAGFYYTDNIPALGWLDALTGMRARLEKNCSELDRLYDEVIEEHMDPMRRQEDIEEDTLDVLLRIHKEDGTIVTIEHVKAILMNILIAGTDGASSTLEWGMSELMRNPQVMKKLQDEVRHVVGKRGKLEEIDLPQLHYMQCVVKEVLRLHPPAPLLAQRETMQQFAVGEYLIPAKARLIINACAIGREEGTWERAEEFDPERFLDNPIDLKGHDFRLIPFGAGRRICPGIQLGLVVVELTLAHLLYAFDWKLPEGMTKEDIDMEENVGLTVHRKNALRLVATKYSVHSL